MIAWPPQEVGPSHTVADVSITWQAEHIWSAWVQRGAAADVAAAPARVLLEAPKISLLQELMIQKSD